MQVQKFDQINTLRFFAVLPVLVVHWGLFDFSKSAEFSFAANGVNLFFAISGFLITLGLIRNKTDTEKSTGASLWKFYVRRVLRIFPIYYLMLLLLWFFNHGKVADGIWWYLTYTTNFYIIKIQNWGGLAHLWSLSLEEQFYLVWPFAILFTPRKFLPVLIGAVIVLSIAVKTYWLNTGASFWTYYMHPLAILDIVGLGGLLAYCYYFHEERLRSLLRNKIFTAFVFAQLAVVILFRVFQHFNMYYDILDRASFGLFSVWLIGRAVFGVDGVGGYILNSSPLQYIGKTTDFVMQLTK